MSDHFDYVAWIFSQTPEGYTIQKIDEDHIQLLTDYAIGEVTIYHLEMDIAELKISDQRTNENTFFLHFELADEAHAKKLFQEMCESLIHLKKKKEYSILLSCTSALTTSFFAEKLNEAAQVLGLSYTFAAVPVEDVYQTGNQKDLVLLAPQIGYMTSKIQGVLGKDKVMQIPTQIFASYNANELIQLVEQRLEQRTKKKNPEVSMTKEMSELIHAHCVLTVGAYYDAGKQRFVYCVYKMGELIVRNELIKDQYDLNDIDDLLGSLFVAYPEIDLVHLTMSGVINKGRLTLTEMGIDDLDMKKWAEEKYHRRFLVSNDVGTITSGWSILHPEYKNICVFIGATGSVECALGTIVDHHLLIGKSDYAGQIGTLSRILTYSENPWQLAKSVDGCIELVGKYLVAAVMFNAPEIIVVFCDMITDIDALSEYMKKYVPENAMPKLIKGGDYREYEAAGAIAHWVIHFRHVADHKVSD